MVVQVLHEINHEVKFEKTIVAELLLVDPLEASQSAEARWLT